MKDQKENKTPKRNLTADEVIVQMQKLSEELGIPYKVITPHESKKTASIHLVNKPREKG